MNPETGYEQLPTLIALCIEQIHRRISVEKISSSELESLSKLAHILTVATDAAHKREQILAYKYEKN